MAEIDKESLIAEVKDLVEKLRPALDADKKRITQDGRKFDVLQWVSGAPDSGKYPAGPAFLPMGTKPTLFHCLMLMTAQDVALTALGGVFFYGMGFAHAPRLGVGSHRMGFWTAVPAVVLGLLGGINKGVYRYGGFMENGNAPLYPGYIENSAPYFMQMTVSDRHASVHPKLQFDPAKKQLQ